MVDTLTGLFIGALAVIGVLVIGLVVVGLLCALALALIVVCIVGFPVLALVAGVAFTIGYPVSVCRMAKIKVQESTEPGYNRLAQELPHNELN